MFIQRQGMDQYWGWVKGEIRDKRGEGMGERDKREEGQFGLDKYLIPATFYIFFFLNFLFD